MASPFALESISGADLTSMINALVAIERNKVTRVETERAGYQLKIDAYGKLRSLLYDIKTKATELSKMTSFDLFTPKSSDEKAVTISGGSGAVDGQYNVNVFQLAANEKMISADGRITSQSATLASQGITTGEMSIGGVSIMIDDNDTIQDLRSRINNATDAKGNKLGITASVLKVSDENFRLVISARESGSTGIAYQDLSGSTLQDLGIIADAAGDKGNVNQMLRSQTDIVAAFNALGTGETIVYAGTDHDGRAVSNTFIKSATGTIDDFLKQVSATFHGMAEVTVDPDGTLVIVDKITGTSRLTVSALTAGAGEHSMSISQVGAEGAGVLSAGKDAYFSIEGLFMQSSVNSISEFVSGVTFDFHTVAAEQPVSVGISRDFSAIQGKFQELIDSYNALSAYAKTATAAADPNVEDSTGGELAGDMTVRSIVNAVRDAFRQQYDVLGSDLTSFTMIGLKSDSRTGEFSLDEKKFKAAVEKNLESVQKLFVTLAVADNANVTLGRSTKETRPGRYILEEVDATHLRIRLENSSEWYLSDARVGDVATFSSGPAKGLSVTAPEGTITGSLSFNFQKGLSTVLDEAVAKLTDTREGVVSLRQTALQKSIARADDRIDTLNTRTEKYRERLVRQFTNMETVLNNMQQQSGRIANLFNV
ncbi:MAG: flagellar filament capping protein FliD [Chitinispirillaceae bacterium]|nr:flagellar filament capping protein FliD [Chitinispirillaceae bacterium]